MSFQNILSYLEDLELHNNRAWFHETHKRYESVKKEFETFTMMLVEHAAETAPEMADKMKQLKPGRFIYRTARDMRYAGGRPPYKTWFACALSDEGREKTAMSFYVQIEPHDRSEIGVGVWFTDNRSTTDRIRRYIQTHADEFAHIMADEEVQSWFCGERVSRPPKGFSADDPMIEYIKCKQWMLLYRIPDSALTDFESTAALCRHVFEKMNPFRRFFAQALLWQPPVVQEDEAQQEEIKEQSVGFWPTARSADDWDF